MHPLNTLLGVCKWTQLKGLSTGMDEMMENMLGIDVWEEAINPALLILFLVTGSH